MMISTLYDVHYMGGLQQKVLYRAPYIVRTDDRLTIIPYFDYTRYPQHLLTLEVCILSLDLSLWKNRSKLVAFFFPHSHVFSIYQKVKHGQWDSFYLLT